MTLAERFSSERHLWFPKSALIMLLILQKTEQAADLLYARPAELLALTAVFPACFALGFFPARKRKETDAGGERQGRFLMELVILPVILSCAFLPGKLRLPAYVPGGSAAWILCGLVLCAALCWFAGCILRRMMLSEDGTAAKGFFPLIAAGGAFGCLLDLIRAESGPQMILCLLLAHFFLVCAVYFRVIRAHAARCGIPLLFTLVLFGFTGWKFHAELMFRPADDGTPVGRVRIPGAGSISLFTGARLTKGEGGIRIFSRGAAVDRRKELRESGPGDVLPLLALPLQDETSDKPRTAVLVTMFASPLAHQLKLLPLIGRMDIFAVGLEEIFMRGGMVTPDRIPAAAAGHDLMILDLPLPSVPALNYIYTRNCFEAIQKMLPRNGVLAVRLPKTGIEKNDILFAGMIQSAMPAPRALLNSPDDSYLVRRADGNPPVTDGGEQSKRLRKLLSGSPLAELGDPMKLVLPILQKEAEPAENGRINTPADPVLLEAVCPGSGMVPAWVRLLREKPFLPVGILLAAYLLCRYFIGWKGVHKPAFQSFEAGFLASGGIAAVSLAGMYFGAAAPALDILTALSVLLILRVVFSPERSVQSKAALSAAFWCAVLCLYPYVRFAVPMILAGLMIAVHLLLGRRNMEMLDGRASLLVADSGVAGLAAGLLYTAVFFNLHPSCAVPAAIPFLLPVLLGFSGLLKKEGSGLY